MKIFAVLYMSYLTGVLAECPHTSPDLLLWSEHSSWTPGQKPSELENVVVDKPILLDVSPPELTSITIEENGRLVFSPDVGDLEVRTRYILVRGEMHIGSEDCKYTANVNIVLTGNRHDDNKAYVQPGYGEKFIGIEGDGVLHLHGIDKLPWTKLAKTVPKLSAENGLKYNHRSTDLLPGNSQIGLSAYVMDVSSNGTFRVIEFGYRALVDSTERRIAWNVQKLKETLKNVEDGQVVLIAVNKYFVYHEGLGDLLDVIEETIHGKTTDDIGLRTIGKYDAYAVAFRKGASGSLSECYAPYTGTKITSCTAELSLPELNLEFQAYCEVNVEQMNRAHSNFLVFNYEATHPVIELIEDVASWAPGDRVVLTSTDNDYKQAEEVTIIACSECSANQIRIKGELYYTHWGEIESRVDMRGEVGLLTRNIKISGKMAASCPTVNGNCDVYDYDTFGGHVKANTEFGEVAIEGVELVNMGQQTDKGSYPLHFHMCENSYSKLPYLRQNSIHHSFARCITVHGTHNVTVQDNVCYDTLGHAYFLEDGGEKYTVLKGNLGAVVRPGNILTTDQTFPTVFWITNPLTYLENNVAAGSEGMGIWYLFPDLPVGPSADKGFMQQDEARYTAYLSFYNNVAHSNKRAGLFIDGRLKDDDGNTERRNEYGARQNPLDPTSPNVEVVLRKFTGYKNRDQNVWIRGGWFTTTQFSLADSDRGITFATSNTKQQQFLTDSVILGETDNVGEPCGREVPVQGYVYYDGAVHPSNIWFNKFKKTSRYDVGAIGFKRDSNPMSLATSTLRNCSFGFDDSVGGNRLFDGDENDIGFAAADGDITATFRDVDGSATGMRDVQIVRPRPFLLTGNCVYRSNWKLALCKDKYATIQMFATPRDKTGHELYRSDMLELGPETISGMQRDIFLVALDQKYQYIWQFQNATPSTIVMLADGVKDGLGVVMGVCLPMDVEFNLVYRFPNQRRFTTKHNTATAVDSIDAIHADYNGGAYFHDKSTGILYTHLFNNATMGPNDTGHCPNNECPSVVIVITKGDLSDTKCAHRLPRTVKKRNAASDLPSYSDPLPHTSMTPPETWGAGPTKPFDQ